MPQSDPRNWRSFDLQARFTVHDLQVFVDFARTTEPSRGLEISERLAIAITSINGTIQRTLSSRSFTITWMIGQAPGRINGPAKEVNQIPIR